jgi:hypothetical protein
MFLGWSEFCYRSIVCCSGNCFQGKKEKTERGGSSSFFLPFFLYEDVFLTKADGEKRDAIYTHTGGSVKRLLVVSDEQVHC